MNKLYSIYKLMKTKVHQYFLQSILSDLHCIFRVEFIVWRNAMVALRFEIGPLYDFNKLSGSEVWQKGNV